MARAESQEQSPAERQRGREADEALQQLSNVNAYGNYLEHFQHYDVWSYLQRY